MNTCNICKMLKSGNLAVFPHVSRVTSQLPYDYFVVDLIFRVAIALRVYQKVYP